MTCPPQPLLPLPVLPYSYEPASRCKATPIFSILQPSLDESNGPLFVQNSRRLDFRLLHLPFSQLLNILFLSRYFLNRVNVVFYEIRDLMLYFDVPYLLSAVCIRTKVWTTFNSTVHSHGIPYCFSFNSASLVPPETHCVVNDLG
jgi:hypothetical protein